MKHPASTSAILLAVVALLVGGATWLLVGSGAEGDDGLAAAPTADPSSQAGFVAISPRERNKQAKLEQAKRELNRIREVGEQVSGDTYKVLNAKGEEMLYKTELIQGVGRNGEPIYLTMSATKRPTVPLKDGRKAFAPGHPKAKLTPQKGVLQTGPKGKGKKADAALPDAGGEDGEQPAAGSTKTDG